MKRELKIFLSSTFDDLEEVRERVLKFLGVLNSDIITMELFGSNESKPKDYCLKMVRECTLFIGIYAEKYGTIDAETGFSLTELEYRQALEMHNKGLLSGVLLYVIHKDALWPISRVERDSNKADKLDQFKKYIGQHHTLTFFKEVDELPFNILRDTIAKLEIGIDKYFTKKKVIKPSLASNFNRPVGMEYFNVEYAQLFAGREHEIAGVLEQVFKFSFSLLIGVSGIGKTSLLNAGILYEIEKIGWVACVIRPLNSPIKNLRESLWNQLLQGTVPSEFSFYDVINTVVDVHSQKKVLIIIDQFEDILYSKKEADELISNLLNVYQAQRQNLRVLISYRGDVESEIGYFWQKVSGAADGLPRFYLSALSRPNAHKILTSTLNGLNIAFESDALVERIINDLEIESVNNGYSGIFPPFIQMCISTIFDLIKNRGVFTFSEYEKVNECRGIIGNYLFSQLDYLAKDKENGIRILTSLVSNYGTKSQKSLDEIIDETRLDYNVSKNILEDLTNLRLVRYINGIYEVTHDLLAKTILAKLVTDDEKNARRFNYLLESKADTYATTTSDLTLLEHLHLYSFRSKISCSKEKLELIMLSYIKSKGPIFYWLNESSLTSVSPELMATFADSYSSNYHENPNNRNIGTALSEPNSQNPIADEDQIKRLTNTLSDPKFALLWDVCIQYVNDIKLNDLRDALLSPRKWKQTMGLIGIGQKGRKTDIVFLYNYLAECEDLKLRIFAFAALINISNRFRDYGKLKKMLPQYSGLYFPFLKKLITPEMLVDISADFLIDLLLSSTHRLIHNDMILTMISSQTDEVTLPQLLNKYKNPENSASYSPIRLLERDLWLQSLRESGSQDFTFYIELILKAEFALEIKYKSKVHERIVNFANATHYDRVSQYVKVEIDLLTEDNWYEKFSELHSDRLAEPDNKYLLSWIMCLAFIKLAHPTDKEAIIKLLNHKLWTVRTAASQYVAIWGSEEDIDTLLRMAFKNIQNEQIVSTIRFLDEKLYGATDLLKHLKSIGKPKFTFYPKKHGWNSVLFAGNPYSNKSFNPRPELIDDLPF